MCPFLFMQIENALKINMLFMYTLCVKFIYRVFFYDSSYLVYTR